MRRSKEEMLVNAARAKEHLAYMEKYRGQTAIAILDTRRYSHTVPTEIADKTSRSEIHIIRSTSADAVFTKTALRSCVLNFSDYKKPGGGFIRGKLTQEESLCHCSNLYPILSAYESEFYIPHMRSLNKGLYTDDALYSPDVIFLDKEREVFCDVITCAAPNCRPGLRYKSVSASEMIEAMYFRIQHVLSVARSEKVERLILGAYGCGIYANNPNAVATAFKIFLEDDFSGCFREVVFPVPDESNFNVFNKILS